MTDRELRRLPRQVRADWYEEQGDPWNALLWRLPARCFWPEVSDGTSRMLVWARAARVGVEEDRFTAPAYRPFKRVPAGWWCLVPLYYPTRPSRWHRMPVPPAWEDRVYDSPATRVYS